MRDTRRLTYETLAEISRQLGTMLSSGIDIVSAVDRIWEREHRPTLKELYRQMLKQLYSGSLLSECMALQGTVFPPWMICMVKAGEMGGGLPEVLLQISKTYEKEARQKRKIQGACLYPAFLLIIMVISFGILFLAVLPQLFELFEAADSLPLGTRFLIGLSRMLRERGLLLIAGTAVLSAAAASIWTLPGVRLRTDRWKIRLPLFGTWLRRVYTARFSRGFSLLYVRGVPILDAVFAASAVTGNLWLESQIRTCAEKMRDGVLMSQAMEEAEGLDERFCVNLMIGEESGCMQELLLPMADRFDQEADEAVHALTVLIEPILIVCMAVMIGFVMWSVIMPVYQYYQSLIQ